MPSILNLIKVIAAVALVLDAGVYSTAPTTENLLVAAGFKSMPASTPRQMQLLQSLTPDKITAVERTGP